MTLSRRQFLEVLGVAGVSISANDWLFSRLEDYANTRLVFRDVRGPGSVSFSRSVCRDCANHCGLAARLVDELPVGLRGTPWHPASQGGLCVAGQSKLQALFDPDRLGKPLLREDAGAPGVPTDWDAALDALSERIAKLLSEGNGERLAVVDGRTPSLGTRMLEAWVHSIPGARYVPLRIEHAIDRLARGCLRGAAGGRLRFDLRHTGTLLLVGHEALEIDGSPVTQMREHGARREDPRRDHAPTLYLGPRQGPTAVHGDRWIPCRPGREREILLSFAEALAREHPERDAIFAEYARWVPEARDAVDFARRFSMESVARRLGFRPDELEAPVEALQAYPPAVALPGPGIFRRPTGFAEASAAFALNLWSGGFAETGGLSWGRDPLQGIADALGLTIPEDAHAPDALATILEPLFRIQRSPVDILICIEANLIHELPGSDQVARALSHVPYLVSFSSHADETSRAAHVTLPTLLDLESWDLPAAAWGFPEASLQVQRPAVVPATDARSVEDVFLDLASRGAAGPGFDPPATDGRGLVEAAVRVIVERGAGELADSRGRGALASTPASAASRALLSGETSWIAAEESGGAATPPPRPIAAAPASSDLGPEQLWLVPFDAPAIQRGRILNRPMMMELSGLAHGLGWECWVEIHPADASARHVGSGARVRIRGPRAEITCRAVVTRSVPPGVVAVPVGFGHRAFGRVATGEGGNPLGLHSALLDDHTGAPAWGPVAVFLEQA